MKNIKLTTKRSTKQNKNCNRGMKMLKKQAALLLIAGALMLGGCFGTNESGDKGRE